MIKIENTEVFGWEAAIRGMRNPMNSWDKSDSTFEVYDSYESSWWTPINLQEKTDLVKMKIGENDLKLMRNLAKAGSDHAKYLRMINVTVDITAPLYWWKEFDTYKVGTVANSCSTMHKIHEKEFDMFDFSFGHLIGKGEDLTCYGAEWFTPLDILQLTIDTLNGARERFLETKDKKYWWQMIQLLPSSYNQKRTVQLNYQVLKAMDSREFHKLDEWREFIRWRNELPYFKEVLLDDSRS